MAIKGLLLQEATSFDSMPQLPQIKKEKRTVGIETRSKIMRQGHCPCQKKKKKQQQH